MLTVSADINCFFLQSLGKIDKFAQTMQGIWAGLPELANLMLHSGLPNSSARLHDSNLYRRMKFSALFRLRPPFSCSGSKDYASPSDISERCSSLPYRIYAPFGTMVHLKNCLLFVSTSFTIMGTAFSIDVVHNLDL
jgi:hypothetical protein